MRNRNTVGSTIVGVALAIIFGAAGWVILGSPGLIPADGLRYETVGSDEARLILVADGETAATIGARLAVAGIISSASSFERLAKITGAERTLVAGEYEFLLGTSSVDALIRIRDGLTATRVVAIPEGWRLEEIAELLESLEVVSAEEFLATANALATSGTAIDVDLLASRPSSATLEGYIYPATYSFSRSVTATEVVLTMVEALSDRFTPQLREETRAQGLTVHQVLTLASIVEREVVLPEERALVASVYRNRLEIEMRLQADPTVQYAITARPGSVVEFGYWKQELSLQDLQFNSTYNTYLQAGLPPAPIANPGIESIIAVIRPAPRDFLFFVARNDGSHAFAVTFEEHQANIRQFQP